MGSEVRWCALLLLATTLTAHAAEDTANIWLERLVHSMSELNYRGVLSYERGDHLESLRVTHGVFDGEQFERLEHLDGEHREIIRRGQQLHCIQLGQHLDLLLHKHILKPGLADLDPYYDIQVDGTDRVAGRRTVEISIQPRDEYRMGYRLALDRETGLLLRSEALAVGGEILERLQFVDVEITKAFKPDWLKGAEAAAQSPAVLPNTSSSHTIDRVIEETQMPWRPRWLPPGFVLALAPHRPSEDVLTYSDGLAVLSVFVAPGSMDMPMGAGRASQGATVAVTKQVSVGGGPFSVTVIGEVPITTAQRVADSVLWSAAP